MRRRLGWMLLILVVTSGSVRADGAIGGLREPDFENTDLHVNVMAGIGLSTLLLFGGVWLIRHPRGRAAYWVVLGLFLVAVDWFFLAHDAIGLLFRVLGFIAFGWGCWRLLSVKEFITGRNLLFLILAVAGATITVVAVNQLKWKVPQWVQDRWRDRQKARERLGNEASPSPPESKPPTSSKPSE